MVGLCPDDSKIKGYHLFVWDMCRLFYRSLKVCGGGWGNLVIGYDLLTKILTILSFWMEYEQRI